MASLPIRSSISRRHTIMLCLAGMVMVSGCGAPTSDDSTDVVSAEAESAGMLLQYPDETLPVERIETAVTYTASRPDETIPTEYTTNDGNNDDSLIIASAPVIDRKAPPPSDSGFRRVSIKSGWMDTDHHFISRPNESRRIALRFPGVSVLATLQADEVILQFGSPTGSVILQNAAGDMICLLKPGDRIRISGFLRGVAEIKAAYYKPWHYGSKTAGIRLGAAVSPYIENDGAHRITIVTGTGSGIDIPPGREKTVPLGRTRILPGSHGGVVLSKLKTGFCEEWITAGGHILRVGIDDGGAVLFWKGAPGALVIPIAGGGSLTLSEGASVKITGGLAVSWNVSGRPVFGVVKRTTVDTFNTGGAYVTDSDNRHRIPLKPGEPQTLSGL